jgi:glycine cleavage system H lipoate-binding protein/ABC-type phosphate transport system substrate-binding protein
MKNWIITFVFSLVLFSTSFAGFAIKNKENPSSEGSICIYCSPDLRPLAAQWVDQYNKLKLGASLTVEILVDENLKTIGSEKSALGLVSQMYLPTTSMENLWQIAIARDIVVPIINAKNPQLAKIGEYGIPPNKLNMVLSNKDAKNWKHLLQITASLPLHYYTYNENSINSRIDEFIKGKVDISSALVEANAQQMIEKIQNDPYALGFCKLSDIVDAENNMIYKNINLLPIDNNENGKLDYMEQIYDNLNAFTRGVWIGKYPHELTTSIYAIAADKVRTESEIAFLNWIIKEGQTTLNTFGYSELVSSEIRTNIDKISIVPHQTESAGKKYADLKAILIIVVVLVLISVLIDFVLFRWNRKMMKKTEAYEKQGLLNEQTSPIPSGLFFDKTYTWAFMEKTGQVKIGLSDFMPSLTGLLSGVKLKKLGDTITKGEDLITLIQQGKQLKIKAPVSGTIKAFNDKLAYNASLLNFSPYDEGWIYLIEPSNWLREIQFMLMTDKFKIWLKTEYLRLKDFLSLVKVPGQQLQTTAILQEGGEIRKSVLKDLNPEVWEDFQQDFIESIE